MDIHNTSSGSSVDASLDKGVVLLKVIFVNGTPKNIVRQELPSNWQPEDIESIVLDEMLHLTFSIVSVVLSQWWPCSARLARSISVAAKVEACNVDTSETEFSRAGWGCRA